MIILHSTKLEVVFIQVLQGTATKTRLNIPGLYSGKRLCARNWVGSSWGWESHIHCESDCSEGRSGESSVDYGRFNKAIREPHEPQEWTTLIIPDMPQMQERTASPAAGLFGQSHSLWLKYEMHILMATTDAPAWYFLFSIMMRFNLYLTFKFYTVKLTYFDGQIYEFWQMHTVR